MTTSISSRSVPGAARRCRAYVGALLAVLVGASFAAMFTVSPAQALTPPAPAPGVTPGIAVVVESNGQYFVSVAELFYTAADGSVWLKNLANGQVTAVGGRLVGGPSAMGDGSSAFVFGRGTDNQLWVNSCNQYGLCGSWQPLGGQVTARPGAVLRGPGAADYSVYARGADGAVWARDHSAAGWSAWHAVGGRLLAGTGPAAAKAYLDGTYLLVVGTNRELYIEEVGVTGFEPAGGATTANPALASIPEAQGLPAALVGFARGTDGAGYYHRFLSSSPGWHSMGGRLTSGLAADLEVLATIPESITLGLGTDSQIYQNTAEWPPYPPLFMGWRRVT